MTYPISEVTRRVVYSGSAGTGPYTFTFEILDQEDIGVYKNTTLLTITTDYTVTINADGTGYVTLTSAATASDTISIFGNKGIERLTDFTTGGDLFANSLNDELDAQTIFAQQNSEAILRSLRAPVTDPTTIDMEIPAKDDRKGRVLGFNATTGDPEQGPEIADVESLAAITTDIALLADIEDGTDATDAIQTVAGISSNVSTVAGISSNVTTVAGNTTNINTVAADLTGDDDIGTVAGSIANVNLTGGSISNVNTTAGSISNVNTVASNISNVNTVGGISSDVTTVAGVSANVTTVAGIDSDVTTVATNVADVTNFADVYIGPSATDPTTRADASALQAGDLYFNTTVDELRVYSGSQWVAGTAGTMAVQRFSGDASTVAFTLSTAPAGENNTQVYIDGVYQQKDTYSVSGTTLTFSEAPPSDTDNIEVVTISTLALGETDASLVTFTQDGTGAVETTVEAKLNETVSVKDFGAVGDGVTDDTAAIQAAIDAVRDTNLNGVLVFECATYLISSTITIYTNTGSQKIVVDFNNAKINHTGSGVALQVGSSTKGFANSVIRNLNLVSSTPTYLMYVTGTQVRDSLFENITITGTVGTTEAGLLIHGDQTYFNKFNNIYINSVNVGMSINWNPVTSSWNSSTYLSNANRFNQISFYDIGDVGIIIGATVGNNFQGLEFDHAISGATYDIKLTASPSQVATNNIIVGRFESGATDTIYVEDGCILNYIQSMVVSSIVYETAADEYQTKVDQVGSAFESKMYTAKPRYYSGFNNNMYFLGNNYRTTLNDTGFIPWASPEGHNAMTLGAINQTWSKLWLGTPTSDFGIINAQSGNARFAYREQADDLAISDLRVRGSDIARSTSGTIRTFELTGDGGLFMVSDSGGSMGIYAAEWLSGTITAIRANSNFQLTSTPSTNKWGIYKSSYDNTISIKQEGTGMPGAYRISLISN